MKTLNDESRMLYAVIQARCPDLPAERFVITYTSEQALRDLLAAPSILASGCTTRECAEEICRGETPRCDWNQPQIYASGSVSCRLARTLWVVLAGMKRCCSFLVVLGACCRRSFFMSGARAHEEECGRPKAAFVARCTCS
jgi:hypothetical protein